GWKSLGDRSKHTHRRACRPSEDRERCPDVRDESPAERRLTAELTFLADRRLTFSELQRWRFRFSIGQSRPRRTHMGHSHYDDATASARKPESVFGKCDAAGSKW